MNTSLGFSESIVGQRRSTLQTDLWQSVLSAYEQKNYKQCIIALLNYIDPAVVKNRSNADQTEFLIPHGSIQIKLVIRPDHFQITAPFVKIPDQNFLPVLRQVSEINFSVLTLSKFILKGNELHFDVKYPIELCEPYKLYYLLKEICVNADYYDDIFIEKFGATRLGQMEVIPYTAEQMEQAWNKFQQFISDAIAYYQYFEGRRLPGFCWDVLYITFMKIEYVMDVQGFLDSEISRCIQSLYGDTPLEEKISTGFKNLQGLQSYSKEKFATSMYKINLFISSKYKASLLNIREELAKNYERAKKELDSSDFMGSTLSLLVSIYSLYDRANMPQEVDDALTNALKSAGGQPWKESAEILYKGITAVMEMEKVNEVA